MNRSLKTKRDLVAELGGFGLKVYGHANVLRATWGRKLRLEAFAP